MKEKSERLQSIMNFNKIHHSSFVENISNEIAHIYYLMEIHL